MVWSFSDIGEFLTGTSTEQTGTSLANQTGSQLMEKSSIDQQQKSTQETQQSTVAEQAAKNSTQNTAASGTTTQTTSQLDAGSTAVLQSLLAGLGGSNAGVLSALQSRAANGNLNTDAIVQAALASAKQNYGETSGKATALLQQLAGSKDNTISQLLAQKGQRDLATQLASTEANIRLQADQQNTAAATAALFGSTSQAQAAAMLGSILKGATQTTTGTSQTTQTTALNELVNSLREGTTTVNQIAELLQQSAGRGVTQSDSSTSTSSTANVDKQGALDWIGSFFS